MKIRLFLALVCCVLALPAAADSGAELLLRVYQKLIAVGGSTGVRIPEIELSGKAYSIAGYRRASNTIFVEKRALEACRSFGKEAESALAFLIGHELTHYYQNHRWDESGGATGFVVASSAFESHVSEEKEADLYGAFLSYLAGYQTTTLIPRLLDVLYASYGLGAEASGSYPSLASRKKVAEEVSEKAEELILIHKTGAYMLALGRYQEAVSCFQYTSKFVRCKEVFNNLGIARLQAAYAGSPMSRRGYRYPLLAAPELVLRSAPEQERAALLRAAVRDFRASLGLSPGPGRDACMHLASAYSMLGMADSVQYWAGRLEGNSEGKDGKAYAAILRGLDAARQSQAAAELFLEAGALATEAGLRALAGHNLTIARGESPPSERVAAPTFIEDRIGGISLIAAFPAGFRQMKSMLLGEHLTFSYLRQESATLLFLEGNGSLIKLHITDNPRWHQASGLGVGNGMDAPADLIPAVGGGAFGVIREKGLVFLLDEQSVIREWGIFMM